MPVFICSPCSYQHTQVFFLHSPPTAWELYSMFGKPEEKQLFPTSCPCCSRRTSLPNESYQSQRPWQESLATNLQSCLSYLLGEQKVWQPCNALGQNGTAIDWARPGELLSVVRISRGTGTYKYTLLALQLLQDHGDHLLYLWKIWFIFMHMEKMKEDQPSQERGVLFLFLRYHFLVGPDQSVI